MPEIYRRRENLPWKMIDEKAVIVDDAEGKVFHMNAVGTEIWKGLDTAQTAEQIVKNLAGRFDEEEKSIRKDAVKFLKSLCDMDLVTKESA